MPSGSVITGLANSESSCAVTAMLATLVPGAGDCAPLSEAIDDAVVGT